MVEPKEEIVDDNYDPEEEKAEGNWKIVDLPEMKLPSGEEEEDVCFFGFTPIDWFHLQSKTL